MFEYKNLENISNQTIANCINLAFSDYEFPIKFNEEQLQMFFKMNGIDPKLSFGAFDGETMIAVTLHSCNIYNQQKSVFCVAAGTIPDYRRRKVLTYLLEYANEQFKLNHIHHNYLEVLQTNHKAIQAYQQIGFSIVRGFVVLNIHQSELLAFNHSLPMSSEYAEFDFNQVQHCHILSPCFEHATSILNLNSEAYEVIYLNERNDISAFVVYTKANGSIVQMGYLNVNILETLICYLLSKYSRITVKNIDTKETEVLQLFDELGFKEITHQYEMYKTI